MKIKLVKYIIGLFIVLFCFAAITKAQDLHFSQYFNAPLLVNPANTGFEPDYDYRLGVNYRDQWPSLGNPYKTMSAWGDAQLFGSRFENGWVGIGGALYKDVAGGGSLTTERANFSIAYHQVLGYNSLLSGGMGFGMVNKRVDISKLTFDNQWTGQFFDGTISSNEPFAYSSIYYFDLQLGVNYAYFASDNVYLEAGVGAMHLNRPKESFYSSNTAADELSPRYTAFLNSRIKIQNLWIVNPNIYVSKMGTAYETVVGVNANRNLSGDGGASQLILGLYYRNKDAIIPMVGFQLNDVKVIMSYDATVSSLGTYNGAKGAYELSLVMNGIYGNAERSSKSIRCPKGVKF